jgi:hypothetical protein
MVVFDEVSTIAFEDGRERIDPVLYPNLAALARDGTLVPLRDGADRHDRHGNPDHPDRHRRQAAPPADPLEPSAQTCSPARPPLPDEGLPGDHRPVAARLCEDASGESAAARDRAPASELGLVYLHVIAPQGIEHDLPSVWDTVAGFGADTGTTTAEGAPGHTGHHRALLHELSGGRPTRFENFVRSIDRRARPTL